MASLSRKLSVTTYRYISHLVVTGVIAIAPGHRNNAKTRGGALDRSERAQPVLDYLVADTLRIPPGIAAIRSAITCCCCARSSGARRTVQQLEHEDYQIVDANPTQQPNRSIL